LMDRFGGLPVEPGDLEAISAPLDWLGMNYYHDAVLTNADPRPGEPTHPSVHPGVVGVRDQDPKGEVTDMGWPITADGLRELLVSTGRTYPDLPPMIIAENGAAYDDPRASDGTIQDVRRIRYLEAHLEAVAAAIAEGADVQGYLVWSLLDNFEWAQGYSQRFGIIAVDYDTLERAPRQSAAWYRDVIARHGLPAREPADPRAT
jgi:beta-glucosidase